jgi:hypothetical protein
MKKLLFAASAVIALFSEPANAQQPGQALVVSSCGGATYSASTYGVLTMDTTGKLCDGSSGGSTTANQGTANTLANGWSVKITDGTNGPVAVKPPSTAPVSADPSLVVGINPNSINGNGQVTKANSAPVTMATDQFMGTQSAAVLGSYCMSLTSGTMAAALAANAPIISFRYGGSGLALVRKIRLSIGDTSTAFAAGAFTFNTFAARTFSASDSGGNAATLTGNNGKMRTSFATTAISDFRVSSTAGLTPGTRTLDSTPLGAVTVSVPATAGTDVIAPTYLVQPEVGEQPLQLANNEGVVVQAAAVPATGTWTFSAQICWDEVTAY